jgi:hypothetical protein
MRTRSVVGYSLDDVNREIEMAIEEAYPVDEGKRFITLFNVTDHVMDAPDKYQILAKQPEKFLKTLVHQYCQIKNWIKFTKSRGTAKSPVFVRPTTDNNPRGA